MMCRGVFWDYAVTISQSGRQKAGKERDWKSIKLRAQFAPLRSKSQLYIWSHLEQLWVSTSGSPEHWLMQEKQSAISDTLMSLSRASMVSLACPPPTVMIDWRKESTRKTTGPSSNYYSIAARSQFVFNILWLAPMCWMFCRLQN